MKIAAVIPKLVTFELDGSLKNSRFTWSEKQIVLVFIVTETGAVGVGKAGASPGPPPFFIQTIFGILAGIGADSAHLMHMRETANKLFGDNYQWSVLAAGRHQMSFVTQAAIMGGNVRVGLEDGFYIGAGELAKGNADQVAKIKRIIEDLSLEVATPTEAGEMLHLKGGDRVAF